MLPAEPAEVPFYKSMFSLYRNTAGTPSVAHARSMQLRPLERTALTVAAAPTSARSRFSNSDHENLIVLKIDHTIDANNTVWYRFQQDTGLQAAYTDPINSIFNSYSPQPQRTLVAGYTHIFGPNLVNQFNPGASWYSQHLRAEQLCPGAADFPIVLAAGSNQAPFTTIGGNDNTYPQGRKVTQWQINDNLTGRAASRSTASASTRAASTSATTTWAREACPRPSITIWPSSPTARPTLRARPFPSRSKSESPRAISTSTRWIPTSRRRKATFTAGVRATLEYRSRQPAAPVCASRGIVSRSRRTMPTSRSIRPFKPGCAICFPPRRCWSGSRASRWPTKLRHGTVVHAGFGVFNDIIPAQIADLAATNAPYAPTFVGGIGGQVGGLAIAPGVANSAADAAVDRQPAVSVALQRRCVRPARESPPARQRALWP